MNRKISDNQTIFSFQKLAGVLKRFWWIIAVAVLAVGVLLYFYSNVVKSEQIDTVKTSLTIYIDSTDAPDSVKNDHVQEAGIMADSLSAIKSKKVADDANKRLEKSGIEKVSSEDEVPLILYDYATSKTATLQITGTDPERSMAIMNAYVESLNDQPQEILKGTKIKVMGNEEIPDGESGVTDGPFGLSTIKLAMIFALAVLAALLIILLLAMFDDRIWSIKDLTRMYSGVNLSGANKSEHGISVDSELLNRMEESMGVKTAAVVSTAKKTYPEAVDAGDGVFITGFGEYGKIPRNSGAVLLICKGRTRERDIELVINQLSSCDIVILGYVFA